MKSYEVRIDGHGNGERLVHVNGQAVPVSMIDPRARLTRGLKAVASAGPGPHAIVAPMPGRIVKVLVAAGDVVTAHQGLVVVEAMKMENELRSPKAGTVTEVRVTEGRSVDANAVLIVME
jgi:biotin carboxyl carrier protein